MYKIYIIIITVKIKNFLTYNTLYHQFICKIYNSINALQILSVIYLNYTDPICQ